MNVENLKTLAKYLRGELKADFEMMFYGDEDCNVTCGTAGCAAGHGPYAGIPKLKDESWSQYCSRAFGFGLFNSARQWCFSAQWTKTDNTPLGAAKRIEYLLEKGLPINWYAQLVGLEPLCYE